MNEVLTLPAVEPRTAAGAVELKFLVEVAVAADVRAWARATLAADPHGMGAERDAYATASVYFDTAARDVFHRRGSYGTSKYRVRRYGASDVVFVERKLRAGQRVIKRRTAIGITDVARLDRVEGGGRADDWAGRWFHRRVIARGLAPACLVAYDRTARQILTPAGVARLTIDEDLRAGRAGGTAAAIGWTHPVLPGQAVVELKYRGCLPHLFKQLVETFALEPGPCSKYRLSLAAIEAIPAIDTIAAVGAGPLGESGGMS